jgi:predicted Zn finger-like uncharacterized protein
MLTRCPQCGTRFRLREPQFQVAGGKVHCGRCGHRFTIGAPVPVAPPPALSPPPPAHRSRGLFWGFAVVLLTLALVLQTVWWQRQRLAMDPTGLRLLQQVCAYAGCQVLPPRAPEQIEVLARELREAPERPGVLRFQLRLVNRAAYAQPYPVVELRLSDHLNRPAGIGRFQPEQYLTGSEPNQVMSPGVPVDLELDLVDPGAGMLGYQIDFL